MEFIEDWEVEELAFHILKQHDDHIQEKNPKIKILQLSLESQTLKSFHFHLEQCVNLIILNDLIDPFLPDFVIKVFDEKYLFGSEEYMGRGALLVGHNVFTKLDDFYQKNRSNLKIDRNDKPIILDFTDEWNRDNILNYFLTYWTAVSPSASESL